MSRATTFIDLIQRLESTDPRKGITLIDTRLRESFHPYTDLYRQCRALAHRFRKQGVRKGQKVLLSFSTNIETICSMMALVTLGAVPFSVPAPLMGQAGDAYRRRMLGLIEQHGVDAVLAGGDLASLSGPSGKPCPAMELELREADEEELASATAEPAAVRPDDLVFVQFSSGSTSRPKGVRITHRNLVYTLDLIVSNDRRTADSVVVSWLPLYHDMGLVGCLLSNFVLGNPLVLMHPRCFLTQPVSWLDAISRHRGNLTAIPNFALDVCTERISDEQLEQHRIDLSTFRYIYDGSEPVRPASIRRFNERFSRYGFVPGSIYPVYGMSETTLIISAPTIDDSVRTRDFEGMEVVSVGFPLGDFQVQARKEDGGPVATGGVGELWVRGTAVTPGYQTPTGSEEGLQDGWLATGDIGSRDEAGRLYILGRKKDLIISQGSNFYGHDIAAAVEQLPEIRTGQVYVFAVDVDQKERIVVMTVPPRNGTNSTPEKESASVPDNGLEQLKLTIRKHVLSEFGLRVSDVAFVPRLPKTTSGKVARHVCEKLYRDSLTRT